MCLVSKINCPLCLQLTFGGLSESAKMGLGGKENFVGCMERIIYNGDNITSLVRRKKVDTSSFVRVSILSYAFLNIFSVNVALIGKSNAKVFCGGTRRYNFTNFFLKYLKGTQHKA